MTSTAIVFEDGCPHRKQLETSYSPLLRLGVGRNSKATLQAHCAIMAIQRAFRAHLFLKALCGAFLKRARKCPLPL